jgi:hypothetical protein
LHDPTPFLSLSVESLPLPRGGTLDTLSLAEIIPAASHRPAFQGAIQALLESTKPRRVELGPSNVGLVLPRSVKSLALRGPHSGHLDVGDACLESLSTSAYTGDTSSLLAAAAGSLERLSVTARPRGCCGWRDVGGLVFPSLRTVTLDLELSRTLATAPELVRLAAGAKVVRLVKEGASARRRVDLRALLTLPWRGDGAAVCMDLELPVDEEQGVRWRDVVNVRELEACAAAARRSVRVRANGALVWWTEAESAERMCVRSYSSCRADVLTQCTRRLPSPIAPPSAARRRRATVSTTAPPAAFSRAGHHHHKPTATRRHRAVSCASESTAAGAA